MKSFLAITVPALFSLALAHQAFAVDGEPYIHDPSTVAFCDGKYFTYGTGGGGLISEDGGWSWHSGAQRPGGGAAPDVIKIGDRYLMAYGATGGGLGGGHNGRILTMWNQNLDPKSPDFKFTEAVVVASSDGNEDCDAIDPSLMLDPTDGKLWLTYGTYFGFIRLVELDPKTGKRVEGNQPVNIAIDCEATDLIYRDGWYYLLGTHGTCCSGANSTYNIRVGRSRKVTGPFLDNLGNDMIKGGGKLVVGASDRHLGPGHFGRMVLGDAVEKFSCHYEADLDRSGRSVLDVRPLLWKDGWPVGGDNLKEGTYEIESVATGYALELGVDFISMAGGMRGMRGGGGPVAPVPLPEVAQVSTNWPNTDLPVRMIDYMLRPNQKWTIAPVAGAGGYLGSPYFKITIAGTDRALAATADGEVIANAAFSNKPEQLWRIDQLTDGTYRIMPKEVPNSKEPLALVAVGYSTPTLAKFDPKSDKSRWNFKTP
jgi:arabinan endo-1,5-alpha-L-arabinosidase